MMGCWEKGKKFVFITHVEFGVALKIENICYKYCRWLCKFGVLEKGKKFVFITRVDFGVALKIENICYKYCSDIKELNKIML